MISFNFLATMLCVKTKILSSSIHGMGLFADEDVSIGTAVWRFEADFDQVFSAEQIARLPDIAQIFLARYAYMSKKTGRFILDTDDGRYFNHSDAPNSATTSSPIGEEDVIVAIRDIRKGEEITIDYSNQEDDTSSNNILWNLYERHGLSDELDPRLKNAVQ